MEIISPAPDIIVSSITLSEVTLSGVTPEIAVSTFFQKYLFVSGLGPLGSIFEHTYGPFVVTPANIVLMGDMEPVQPVSCPRVV